MLIRFCFLSAILSCLLAGCGGTRNKLVLVVIPSDDMLQTAAYAENFCRYLSRETGHEIVHYNATDYTAVIEAMRTGKCDIAQFGPFSYLLASQAAGAEAVASMGYRDGGLHTYQSILVARPESGISDIASLAANPSRFSIALSDPASASGHLIPRIALSENGADLINDFKSYSFAMSHAASLLSVYSGKTDVGAASYESYKRLHTNGIIDTSELRIIWVSAPQPTNPTCLSKNLSKEMKHKITEAMLQMHIKDTASFGHYIRYAYSGKISADSMAFVPINGSSFSKLKTAAQSMGLLKQ
jgi:phosphonate transport system substrate-binding protein